MAHAKPIVVKIGDTEYKAMPKEFASGSFGWSFASGHTFHVHNANLPTSMSLNMTVRNTKPKKADGNEDEGDEDMEEEEEHAAGDEAAAANN